MLSNASQCSQQLNGGRAISCTGNDEAHKKKLSQAQARGDVVPQAPGQGLPRANRALVWMRWPKQVRDDIVPRCAGTALSIP